MYKACIFDLDGTLADTLESLVFSVNQTLQEMGLPFITEEQCRRFVGNGARVLIEKALLTSGEDAKSRLEEGMERYRRIFDANCTYHVIPYEGIETLLDVLKKRGMKLAVLSNKPDAQAVKVAEEVFGRGRFDQIQGQKEGVPRKPDPSAALAIAKSLGATVEETIYIGDSEVDIATGRAAKMLTIGVAWGFRGAKELKEAGAGYIVGSPDEIIKLIEKKEENGHE
ncbi:HAD family hydrolase [Mediterraneibacter sp. NSJ-55]|uniref:HAD family hydrolase n=1 Tax=Mediterraneibacter hominis TaxID=2763054 RepID=A0A923LFW8_9FIRM|nr:HAD family hydrolase [Mediterraneibacter hominis]MBC5687575.1 HAD family hydrolase [Mediterraneibacter hominis]